MAHRVEEASHGAVAGVQAVDALDAVVADRAEQRHQGRLGRLGLVGQRLRPDLQPPDIRRRDATVVQQALQR